MALFGETRKQTFYGLAENLAGVLEVKYGTRESPSWSVRFKQHPAEETFMEALRGSEETLTRGQVALRVLGQHEGFDLLRGRGYREDEIGFLLRMLKARRLVDFDDGRQCFVEVLESPGERREAILAALADLIHRGEVLAQVPDFERERFRATTQRLTEQVSTCDDVEKLEEYQARLTELRDDQARFIKKWAQTIQTHFDHTRQDVGAVLRASLPADLTRPLKSDVNWVGELAQCQALLKDKYQRSSATFRAVESRVTTAWNTWTGASPHDPAALLVLYTANLAAQSELKEAQAELEAAGAYLRSYVAWSNVLNIASRAYHEAIGCAVSYREERFQRQLDAIFGEIAARFQKKWLEALPNHEMYAEQIEEVQKQVDDWLRGRRDTFMEDKRCYEETLKAFGVGRFNLRAGFDPFDPETSRSSLYSEVLEKTLQHVQSLEGELERHRIEAVYAEQVAGADVSGPARRIRQAQDELAQVRRQAHESCVRQQECFASLGSALGALGAAIQEVEKGLQGVLQKREPTPEEEAILSVLQDPKGADLRVVIASRLAAGGESFSLDELMKTIASLFRKNQVVIHLERMR